MALIENAKGRRENQSPSGYTRLFGIAELGNLMSRIQGTVISSGTELEKLIYERATKIPDLDLYCTKCHKNIVYRKFITGHAICQLCRDGMRVFKKRVIGRLCNPNFVFTPNVPKKDIAKFMELQKHYRGGKYRK